MGNKCTTPDVQSNYLSEINTDFQHYIDEKNRSIPQTGHVKVLTFNIFIRPPLIKNNDDDFKDERINEFLNLIDSYDIICLQEMFATYSNRRSYLIQKAREAGFLYSAECGKPDTFTSYFIDGGLVILSRYPIEASDFHVLTQGLASDFYAQKGALYCKIRVGNSRLHLYTIHTQATYDKSPKWFIRRSEQFIGFQRFITESLMKNDYQGSDLVLLTGDFNVDARLDRHYKTEEMRSIPTMGKYKSLMAKESFTEYNSLISCLTDDYRDEVEDLLLSSYKEHPITYGDYYINGKNEKKPKETVLTHKGSYCKAESLDYIFRYTPKNLPIERDSHTSMSVKQRLSVVEDSAKVVEFLVNNHNFDQLSDHYGASVTLQFSAGDAEKEVSDSTRGSTCSYRLESRINSLKIE